MKALIILGFTGLIALSGCSTNSHLLEPGVNKRKDVSPEAPKQRACCGMSNCSCGDCSDSGPCECRKGHVDPNPPTGITP